MTMTNSSDKQPLKINRTDRTGQKKRDDRCPEREEKENRDQHFPTE
jgi:hypothetical protein